MDWRSKQPLKHPVNLSGMRVGDFFYFCDECGYQHKTNFVISGRCPECKPSSANMIECTVTEHDREIWNSAVQAALNDLDDKPVDQFLIKPKA